MIKELRVEHLRPLPEIECRQVICIDYLVGPARPDLAQVSARIDAIRARQAARALHRREHPLCGCGDCPPRGRR